MSQVTNESLDATPFTQAVKCWQQYEALLKRSGELLCESEKCHQDSLTSLVETSRLLCEAFEERDGDWRGLWKDKKHSLPFSKSKADRLRAIWPNTTLRDSANWRKLPADVSLVEDLATIPAAKLQAAIEDGRVRPKMTGKQVLALRDGVSTPPSLTPEDEVRRALRSVRRRLGATAEIAKLVRQITEEVWPEEEAEAPVREEAAA